MKPIRNSAKAIINRGNRVLLTKNRDDAGIFYLFPGGGQEAGEDLRQAVIRECREEIQAEIVPGEIAYIREYIGSRHEFAEEDRDVHQVEFYFRCTLADPEAEPSNGPVPDPTQIGVEWVELEKLDFIRLYPKALAAYLQNPSISKIYLGDVN